MQPNRALVTKPDNLSLVPNPTRCQERTSSCRLSLASTCMDICGMCMGTRAHINRWINKKQDEGWPLASTCMYVCTQIPTWTPLGAYPPQPSHRIYILTRATLKLVCLWLEPHSRQGFRIHFFSCWIPAGSMCHVFHSCFESQVPWLVWPWPLSPRELELWFPSAFILSDLERFRSWLCEVVVYSSGPDLPFWALFYFVSVPFSLAHVLTVPEIPLWGTWVYLFLLSFGKRKQKLSRV